jgi:hypothetical protein
VSEERKSEENVLIAPEIKITQEKQSPEESEEEAAATSTLTKEEEEIRKLAYA